MGPGVDGVDCDAHLVPKPLVSGIGLAWTGVWGSEPEDVRLLGVAVLAACRICSGIASRGWLACACLSVDVGAVGWAVVGDTCCCPAAAAAAWAGVSLGAGGVPAGGGTEAIGRGTFAGEG